MARRTMRAKEPIYLCGPMSGREQYNYPLFHEMAERLRAKGLVVLSPAEHDRNPADSWESFMRQGIERVLLAGSVAVLAGWELSRGATLEVKVARAIGLEVVRVDDLLEER
jgi:hypothetical protein